MFKENCSSIFPIDEYKETLLKLCEYDKDSKREKRELYTFATGTTYDGEWKGALRDGYGLQKWIDGSSYEG